MWRSNVEPGATQKAVQYGACTLHWCRCGALFGTGHHTYTNEDLLKYAATPPN